MLAHHVTAAIRALTKSWTYTFINIFGLAVGLAASLMILTYVRYELTYDHWLPDSERIYQVQTQSTFGPGREPNLAQGVNYPAAAALRKDFPQIEKMVYFHPAYADEMTYRGRARRSRSLYLADGPFFDVVSLPFEQGDPNTALADAQSLVLTKTAAEELFGSRPPIGQTLSFKFGELMREYRVTGVLKDLPKNSHLDFQMLGRFDPSSPPGNLAHDLSNWHFGNHGMAYAKLRQGSSVDEIAAGLPAWQQRNQPPPPPPTSFRWKLVNVRDIHLGEAWGMRPNADKGFIKNFAVVGFLILAMACINFTNLATARAGRRAREVALRKLLGATRKQLIVQFLAEALLLTAFAMIVALALLELLMPVLSRFLDTDLAISYPDWSGTVLPIIALTLLVGIAGGAYPAFYLSRFLPARVLKANASTSEAPGSGRLRSFLVVAQFAISIGLIACTAVIYNQTVFARTVDPGYRRAGILEIGNSGYLKERAEAFAQELSRLPGVRSVTRSGIVIGRGSGMTYDLTEPGMAEPLVVQVARVDPAFMETMGMNLVAGRNFDPRRGGDEAPPLMLSPPKSAEEQKPPPPPASTNIIISESAARRFGFRSPVSIVGKTLKFSFGGGSTSTVIGVVQNVRFGTVREPVLPAAYVFQREPSMPVLLRYEGNPVTIRKGVEALWRRMMPEIPIEARFSEDVTQELYGTEEKRGQLFGGFAILAVLISSLGLYGLAAFTAERRTKEIGIRKVLGAKVRDIVRLLVWQFSKPVLVANLIAWPVAWWFMRDWLNGFDARIALTAEPFLTAGLLALVVAVATVAWHSVKVARANPIAALRYE